MFLVPAEAVGRNMTKEDLTPFTDDALADFKDMWLDWGCTSAQIGEYKDAGVKTGDAWMKRRKKSMAFDELATKLKASVEQVKKWKAFPERCSGSKRPAEEMVFASVEELGERQRG